MKQLRLGQTWEKEGWASFCSPDASCSYLWAHMGLHFLALSWLPGH
jgi:hypothetical protein